MNDVKITTVIDLINILKTFPANMPVSIDYAGNEIEAVNIITWVDSNYPWNHPDKDYVVIQ